tara:strand:+ start:199 stop:822 length:624 start_codon:yes stop_codon:yes gene_type:complete
MPILKIKKNKNYTYAIWNIEEDLDELLNALNPTESEHIETHNISHINRRKQNIAARLLLNHLAMKKVKLKYAQNGAPCCKEFKHISISHSKNYCALIVSNNNIGVDIQYQKKNISDLQKKFINTDEELYLNTQNKNEKLHFIWCAKEAIYKTLNNPNCSLKEDIYILNLQSNLINSYYKYRTPKCIQYQVEYDKIKNYFIAIAIQKS